MRVSTEQHQERRRRAFANFEAAALQLAAGIRQAGWSMQTLSEGLERVGKQLRQGE